MTAVLILGRKRTQEQKKVQKFIIQSLFSSKVYNKQNKRLPFLMKRQEMRMICVGLDHFSIRLI